MEGSRIKLSAAFTKISLAAAEENPDENPWKRKEITSTHSLAVPFLSISEILDVAGFCEFAPQYYKSGTDVCITLDM